MPSRLTWLCVLITIFSCHTPAPLSTQARQAAVVASMTWLGDLLDKRARRIAPRDRERMVFEIARAKLAHGLDPLLVLAVIEQESRFDPRARGPKGSLGLMQVRPFVGADVARRHGIPWRDASTLLEPATNLRIGMAYLAEMIAMYPDEMFALTAYNMGPYRLRRVLARGARPRGSYAAKVGTHRRSYEGRVAALR